MSTDTLFLICNYSVMPAWALLFLAPGWKGTQLMVHSALIPLGLALLYAYFALTSFGSGEGSFGSLEGVMKLFTEPEAVLAGWIHYLVFDLFIGAWEARDARRLGIHHALLAPCMLFTLMLGPVGLFMYFMLRWTLRRVLVIDEAVIPTTP